MNRRRALLAWTGAAWLLSGCGNHGGEAAARAEVEKAYDSMYAAESRKDLEGYLSYFAPDYMQVDKGEKSDLAHKRQLTAKLFAILSSVQAGAKVQDFHLSGNNADATVRRHLVFTFFSPKLGKETNLNYAEVDQEKWIKGAKGWQMQRSYVISSEEAQDGQPAAP